MTTTFDPALSTARDRLRFALGDTNVSATKSVADALALPADDAIYDGVLSYHGNDERKAGIALADALIARYSQEPTKVNLTNVEQAEWVGRLQAWRDYAGRMRAEVASVAATSTGTTVVTQRANGAGRSEYTPSRSAL